jgi:hypothetical protein
MRAFTEVQHELWIAAPPATVRSQFADLDHHIRANVHPKLRFEILQRGAQTARYLQEVKLLGIRQRDIFERRFDPDGTMTDTSVEGFNKDGALRFQFAERQLDGRIGTQVTIRIKLPLPPVIGKLIKPLLDAQVRRELRAAAAEDKNDIERRGYQPGATAKLEVRSAAA